MVAIAETVARVRRRFLWRCFCIRKPVKRLVLIGAIGAGSSPRLCLATDWWFQTEQEA